MNPDNAYCDILKELLGYMKSRPRRSAWQDEFVEYNDSPRIPRQFISSWNIDDELGWYPRRDWPIDRGTADKSIRIDPNADIDSVL